MQRSLHWLCIDRHCIDIDSHPLPLPPTPPCFPLSSPSSLNPRAILTAHPSRTHTDLDDPFFIHFPCMIHVCTVASSFKDCRNPFSAFSAAAQIQPEIRLSSPLSQLSFQGCNGTDKALGALYRTATARPAKSEWSKRGHSVGIQFQLGQQWTNAEPGISKQSV